MLKYHSIPQRFPLPVSLHPSPPSMDGGPLPVQGEWGIRDPSPASNHSNQLLVFKRQNLDLSCSGAAFLLRWINEKQRKKSRAKSPWEGNRGGKALSVTPSREASGSPWLEKGCGVTGGGWCCCARQYGTGHLGGMMLFPSKPSHSSSSPICVYI